MMPTLVLHQNVIVMMITTSQSLFSQIHLYQLSLLIKQPAQNLVTSLSIRLKSFQLTVQAIVSS